MSSFHFETTDIPTETTRRVRGVLDEGRPCLVVGALGTGKSHAVRQAVNGAVWVNLSSGPLQGAQFFADIARQVDDGRSLLTAVAQGDRVRTTQLAEDLLGPRCLVVDRAERLGRYDADSSWDDPQQALMAQESAELMQWLVSYSRHRVVLVSRRSVAGWTQTQLTHRAPPEWPMKLTFAPGGWRDWPRLARLVDRRPGGMTLARAIIPFIGPRAFDHLLDELGQAKEEDGGSRTTEVLKMLARKLLESSPPAWVRVLQIVDALDGGPSSFIENSFDDADERAALVSLRTIGLIEERNERLTVLSVLRDVLREFTSDERVPVLRDVATKLLTLVNDPRTLIPEEADIVLRAHRLFVESGDFGSARRTATLHIAGLIDLAKRSSLQKDWAEALRRYDAILEVLDQDHVRTATESGRHVLSYVVHYRAFNEQRANDAASDHVITEYGRSIELWPENALWRQHLIEASISRGDLAFASEQVERAYEAIAEHPRRDTVLRIRPAVTAMQSGVPMFALELTSNVNATFEQDPEGVTTMDQLHQAWERGIAVSSLSCATGELYFRRRSWISLKQRHGSWQARPQEFSSAWGRGDTPLLAIRDLAERLGAVAHELLSTPAHLLDDEDIERKSELIAYLDPLNSDIGLAHAGHRWLLGRLEGDRFIAIQRADFEPIVLPADVRADHDEGGLYFAKVPVLRDGHPLGPVEMLRPAGNGRPVRDLIDELAALQNTSGRA